MRLGDLQVPEWGWSNGPMATNDPRGSASSGELAIRAPHTDRILQILSNPTAALSYARTAARDAPADHSIRLIVRLSGCTRRTAWSKISMTLFSVSGNGLRDGTCQVQDLGRGSPST